MVEEIRRRRRGSASASGRRTTRPSSRAAGAALRRKVRELRRLVPGGKKAPAGSLLARTADYIVRLRARVELLRALAAVYGVGGPPQQVVDRAAAAGTITTGVKRMIVIEFEVLCFHRLLHLTIINCVSDGWSNT
ncbi:hypothetical protein BAE44_0008479 [Dichanthelium oligosanthes]|uniref:BHLH domain-containing protein n=1 Tax=Dichanthelium oligosanthes TaxID=888268 RepID=A0A1E5VZE9_9POAL|nr:hypothetical protein BAE44_0008479 [Dichanthelium oligosanthes]